MHHFISVYKKSVINLIKSLNFNKTSPFYCILIKYMHGINSFFVLIIQSENIFKCSI